MRKPLTAILFQVEFPEARIFEETLNVLLYEHRNGPDADLMLATSVRGAAASSSSNPASVQCTSDDEEDLLRMSSLRMSGVGSSSGASGSSQNQHQSSGLGRLRPSKNN